MMPTRYSTTKSSAVTATNASSMIAPVALTAATCDQNKAVKKHITTTIDCSTQSECEYYHDSPNIMIDERKDLSNWYFKNIYKWLFPDLNIFVIQKINVLRSIIHSIYGGIITGAFLHFTSFNKLNI